MLVSLFLSGASSQFRTYDRILSVMYSQQEEEESDNFTSIIGLMQALISVFIDDGDKLRCINSGGTRITFLMRSPLYYACVSSWGEPESVVSRYNVKRHLETIYTTDFCEGRYDPILNTCTYRYSV